MWLSMKSFFFPLLLAILVWFWKRIVNLDRQSNLIERYMFILTLIFIYLYILFIRTLFAVGLSATLLNCIFLFNGIIFDSII